MHVMRGRTLGGRPLQRAWVPLGSGISLIRTMMARSGTEMSLFSWYMSSLVRFKGPHTRHGKAIVSYHVTQIHNVAFNNGTLPYLIFARNLPFHMNHMNQMSILTLINKIENLTRD